MYIRTHVIPGARKESIEEGEGGVLMLRVREPASGNQANKRIREIIAERFNTSLANVRILTGHRSPSKMISINT